MKEFLKSWKYTWPITLITVVYFELIGLMMYNKDHKIFDLWFWGVLCLITFPIVGHLSLKSYERRLRNK
jgi:hypothetical protein